MLVSLNTAASQAGQLCPFTIGGKCCGLCNVACGVTSLPEMKPGLRIRAIMSILRGKSAEKQPQGKLMEENNNV
ncbi:hypothetical protein HN51_026259 [Arachis hypogaea]